MAPCYSICLVFTLRFVASSLVAAIGASYQAIFTYTVPEENVLTTMFKRIVRVIYVTLILCVFYVFFSRAHRAFMYHKHNPRALASYEALPALSKAFESIPEEL